MADMVKKQKKLGKLNMPAKRLEEKELELDLGDMEEPEMEADLEGADFEAPEAAESEVGEEGKAGATAEKLSDDELLAEIKKRGLVSQLGEEGEKEEENEEEIYS